LDGQNRSRAGNDLNRPNGGADFMRRPNGGIDPARRNGPLDSTRPASGPSEQESVGGFAVSSATEQHRRSNNGDYGKQNGMDGGDGEPSYPGRSQQYARNWPPVSQTPAEQIQASKVCNFNQF
jgi:hypothetical protein